MLKQGFGFIVHALEFLKLPLFKSENKDVLVKNQSFEIIYSTITNIIKCLSVIIKSKYQTRDEIKRTQSCGFVLYYFDVKFCPLFCINKPIN